LVGTKKKKKRVSRRNQILHLKEEKKSKEPTVVEKKGTPGNQGPSFLENTPTEDTAPLAIKKRRGGGGGN